MERERERKLYNCFCFGHKGSESERLRKSMGHVGDGDW